MMSRRIVAVWMLSFSQLDVDVVFAARQVHDLIRIELVAVSHAVVRGQVDARTEFTNLGVASSTRHNSKHQVVDGCHAPMRTVVDIMR